MWQEVFWKDSSELFSTLLATSSKLSQLSPALLNSSYLFSTLLTSSQNHLSDRFQAAFRLLPSDCFCIPLCGALRFLTPVFGIQSTCFESGFFSF
jgi:hypothetical protein